jgi:nuclear pore complex protein Nup93
MDALVGVHQRAKQSVIADTTRQVVSIFFPSRMMRSIFILHQTLSTARKKSRSLMIFAGMLKYRMSPDVYSYLARLDVEIAL